MTYPIARPLSHFQAPRHRRALWCGRAVQPTPEKRRALFERSEFARRRSRRTAQGTRRAMPRPTWFWVLLPKQKDLVCRGETRHLNSVPPTRLQFESYSFVGRRESLSALDHI
ncbi:MAG: hypothetical protein ACERKU_00885, partial [Nitrospirota bacterium]